jgi:hypothetical protein
VASSSSASKVARLAQKGKGKKVRFQGGTLFPLVIVIVVVVLGALVVYARQSRPSPGAGAPTANDHWHAALSFYVCDENGLVTLPNLTGTLEDTDAQGQLSNQRYLATGIHSHGDGVMHWHPNSSGKATGTNAKLGVFLKNYGVTLTNTKLALPADQGGQVFEEGKSTCKINGADKSASLKVWVWNSYTNATSGSAPDSTYTANMGDARITNDGMVFVVAFVPDDTPPTPPADAARLPELGAADGGGTTQTPTSVSGDTTVTTVVGETTTIFGAATTVAGTPSSDAPEATSTTTATSTGETTSGTTAESATTAAGAPSTSG